MQRLLGAYLTMVSCIASFSTLKIYFSFFRFPNLFALCRDTFSTWRTVLTYYKFMSSKNSTQKEKKFTEIVKLIRTF
jgi:hypothetical protein